MKSRSWWQCASAFALVGGVCTVFAGVVTIDGIPTRQSVTGNAGNASSSFTAATIHDADYPAEAGTPIFWFDCTETNGWTFVDENGATYVTRIPSKVGNRYLTLAAENGDFRKFTLEKPFFAPGGAKVGNRSVVDFGAMNSKRALLFNAFSEGGGTYSNRLDHIGTVITVFDASQGGGLFLGGGDGVIDTGWYNGGCLWLRNGDNPMGAGYSYLNFVARGSTPSSWYEGTLRRNGVTQRITDCGFADTWEVVSVICKRNNMNAWGLALGDARYTTGEASGGQRIAEMLIFDTVLDTAVVAKIERWLQNKWLDYRPAGVNGTAVMGPLYADRSDWNGLGFPITVDVPAGETVSLYRNQHGRGGCYSDAADIKSVTNLSAFVKTGAGTFALCDAAHFQGVVRLQEGCIEVPQRAIPEALPSGAFVHMDASVADSLVTETDGDVEFVKAWRNLDPSKTMAGKAVLARPPTTANRPVLMRNELGAGLNVLDFGEFTQSLDGQYLAFTTDDVENETVTTAGIPQCMTVVALVGAQNGGGHFVGRPDDSPFRRAEQNPTRYDQGLFSHNTEGFAGQVNGVPMAQSQGYYQHAGYQTIALRQTGINGNYLSKLQTLNAWGGKSGGGRLAEVAIYTRMLTEQEMRDAQAYLMHKWLGRTAPGYARPATLKSPMLQNLMVEGDGEIHVPAGETLLVGTISGDHDLVKTGAGTLKYQTLTLADGKRIVVREGRIATAPLPDVASNCACAEDPSVDLDASALESMILGGTAEDPTVKVWMDQTRANTAFQHTSSQQPHLKTNGPNGLPWLDFGGLLPDNGARGMNLSVALNNVRAAYVVCRLAVQPEGYTGDYPMPLGSKSNLGNGHEPIAGVICDFLRQQGWIVSYNPGATCAYYGDNYIDGVSMPVHSVPATEVWQLLEFHPKGGSHLSAFGIDRSNLRGGFALGEVLVYERPLTEREKVATRNHLMKKWLGKTDAELAPLPAASTWKVNRLVGEGTFEKDEAQTLELADWSAFDGVVEVNAGTLALTKSCPQAEPPACVTDGLFFQADASRGITATTNGGVVQVMEWASALGDGWVAKPARAGYYPTYILADELNGGNVVDMAQGQSQALVFYKDGARKEIDNIKCAFWMFGSQSGGGFLMGGGENVDLANDASRHSLSWHRGGNAGFGSANAKDAILNSGHCAAAPRNADWRKNGVAGNSVMGLSGAWDLLTMNVKENEPEPAHAHGFAFDGRYLDSGSYTERLGSQRLAEVLLYNRRLDADEIEQVEEYLRAKWQFGVQAGAATNVDVRVAAGATLDLGGGWQRIGAFAGAGSAVNGTLQVESLVVDVTATATPTVEHLVLTAGTKIELANLEAAGDLRNREFKILDAGTIEGVGEVKPTAFTGEAFSNGLAASLVVRNGALYVKFQAKGVIFFVR